jgi:tetratricopeptide (TPR) repeat protein
MKHVRSLLFLLALAPSTAFADAKAEAKIHIDKATAFHGDGKFKQALDELTLAYALDPKPELLYAIGQVHVQLGNCTEAIAFYERFLTTKPAAGPTAAAKEAIQSCKSAAPPEPKPDPKPDPVPDPKPDPEPVKDPEPPPNQPPPKPETPPSTGGSPWYKDVIGDVLVSGGIVSGVLGVVFYTQMSAKLDDAEDRSKTTTIAEHDALRDEARSKRNLALGFGIGGVALVGAGIVRYMMRDNGERSSKVAVTPTSDGGLITVMGRF